MSKNKLTRRRFLKNAAATAAGAIAAPYVITSAALGNGTTPSPSERITLGHIGVGGQGGSLLQGFLHLNDAQCVAVCDPFKSRREKWVERIDDHYAQKNTAGSYKGCSAYNDFRELLARDDIDAVVIATPDHWHVPIALAAARAGKDMYVEKPLGISVAHDQALREAISRYGNVFQYGTQQRSSRHCRFGCELVRNGRIGKVHTIHVVAPNGRSGGSTEPAPLPKDLDYNLWLGPAPMTPYTKDRCTNLGAYHIYDYALGFIAGWGAHPLDILQWGYDTHLAGQAEFEGTGMIPTEGLFNTVINWDVRIRYASGLKMTFKPGSNSTQFVGTEGWVRIWRRGIDAEPKSLLKSTIAPDEIHLIESQRQDQNFLDCIKTRAATVSPIEAAVYSDIISHLSDIAIRTGRKIKWDPEKEVIIGDEQASRMLTRPMRSPWHL